MSSTRYAKKSPPPLFGPWLRELREQKGVTLREAAAVAKMDLAHLSKAERGRRTITKEQTAALAAYYGVDATQAEARRLAAKFWLDNEEEPAAAAEAVQFLAEQAASYKAGGPKGKGRGR
jgi:HTH-type transcriptional regulator, competence development regulator